ncbi:hypothetical protein E2C01_038125 [Portunus trituberculatus]|uniref:Uncharacterized protein n=1 Tax=Portunus trituberculatus TaxID=210409 RepID=A0A5B7FDB9_PORTR|nr:hypothetical protein [Portunus trituberculatus]
MNAPTHQTSTYKIPSLHRLIIVRTLKEAGSPSRTSLPPRSTNSCLLQPPTNTAGNNSHAPENLIIILSRRGAPTLANPQGVKRQSIMRAPHLDFLYAFSLSRTLPISRTFHSRCAMVVRQLRIIVVIDTLSFIECEGG